MSFIQKEISDFTVQAYVDGGFKEVTKEDVLGKWSVFFFYPADFTFVCPTELEDLADPTGALARSFDVMIEEDGVAERASFIVNPEGKIVAYEVIAGNVGRNADELFRRVQASQFVAQHGDEVCPAKWKPGAETLKPSLDLVGLI